MRTLLSINPFASVAKAWPGRAAANHKAHHEKAMTVEEAIGAGITLAMGARFDPRRFIPYVMMHEFEAMLFSDCEKLCYALGLMHLVAAFQEIRDGVSSPEEINDSSVSAPSKRIKALVPSYEKPLSGSMAVMNIRLETIRTQCPNFNRWLGRLEHLGLQSTLLP